MVDLPAGGEVGVFVLLTQIVMMVRVVDSKAERRWNAHSDIAEYSKGLVDSDIRMSSPMREVVNEAMAGVAEGSTYNISYKSKDRP